MSVAPGSLCARSRLLAWFTVVPPGGGACDDGPVRVLIPLPDRDFGAMCHGVLVLARTRDAFARRSVLAGRRTTCLSKYMERVAYLATALAAQPLLPDLSRLRRG